MSDFARQRRMMVDNQLRTYDVSNAAVLAAMDTVPRERFVAAGDEVIAYVDRALPLTADRSMTTPMVLARLIQTAEVEAEDKVLVVGAATGYAAVVLSHLAGAVTALESDEGLAATARSRAAELGQGKVTVVSGALDKGYAAAAPYDVILVDGSVEVEPKALLDQLSEGGRLVCVKGVGRSARAMLHVRSGGATSGRVVFDCAAPLLPAFAAPREFTFG